MISTLSRTRSAASWVSRSGLPSACRWSITMLRPSVYPSWPRLCQNASASDGPWQSLRGRRSAGSLSSAAPRRRAARQGGRQQVRGMLDDPHFPKSVIAQPMKGRPVLSSKMAGPAKCQQNQGMCRGHAVCTRPVYHDRSGGLGGSTGGGEVRGAPPPSAGRAAPPDAGDTSVAALTSGAPPASPAAGAWKCGCTSWWFLRRAVAGLVPMEGHVQPVRTHARRERSSTTLPIRYLPGVTGVRS